ncbi:hypothetical protein [Flavobacterium hiemivividum]|uniref:hypothetical protein n=1 Tax=Flavobacterium hiemivividum TaxID=2541734 RepID=UPI0014043431|nr:hypothetical protein [Flavobacterium hiemivividum]
MDTVIAIWHTGGKGKSGTILALANLLVCQYPNINNIMFYKLLFCKPRRGYTNLSKYKK